MAFGEVEVRIRIRAGPSVMSLLEVVAFGSDLAGDRTYGKGRQFKPFKR